MRFEKSLDDVLVTSFGAKATFECDVTRPNLKADWLKGDSVNPLRRGDKYDVVVDGCKHLLTVHDVTAEDVGSYTISIEGQTCNAKLKLEGLIFPMNSFFHKSHI